MVIRKYKKTLAVALGCIILLAAGFLMLRLADYHPSDILGKALALRLRHAKISLEKLGDIFFIPYVFSPTDLPVYQLTIKSDEMRALNDPLKSWDPDSLIPLQSDKKVWAKGFFSFGGYFSKIKVRYRGDSQIHWAHDKKSFLVEFPQTDLFQRMRRVHLIVPEAQEYYIGLLNDYRAKKLGLLSSPYTLVRLRLNGQDRGVYFAEEDMGQEWLDKQGLLGYVLSYDGDSVDPKDSVLTDANIALWKTSSLTTEYNSDPMKALKEVLTYADNDTFRAIAPTLFDLNSFYAWDIMTVLSQSREQNDIAPSNNTQLFFDITTGRFSVIPYNIRIREEDKDIFYNNIPLITQRILSVPEFKQARDEKLKKYIAEEKEDDLKFYDDLYKKTKKEFLGDTAKFNSDFTYLSLVEKLRSYVQENFARAEKDLTHNYSYKGSSVSKNQLNLPETFRPLLDVSLSPEEFVQYNPEFIVVHANTIRLLAGSHFFYKTVFIPRGVKLIIDPGASLFFAQGVSMVSYSPVLAQGRAENPITFTAIDPKKRWGSFLVVATGKEKNLLSNVIFSYGSEFKEKSNGLVATGMISFYKSDVAMQNSRIEHTGGEDSLNIKYANIDLRGNNFYITYADAFDCDSCSGSVENNTFRTIGVGENTHTGFGNSGGDAIDISFSNLTIRSNTIIGATDKGISVGEKSTPKIEKNIIIGNNIGIAVKDLSRALISDDLLIKNKHGIELYEKKAIFGSAYAVLSGSILWLNGEDVSIVEKGSTIEYGSGNIIQSQGASKPNLASLLPLELLPLVK